MNRMDVNCLIGRWPFRSLGKHTMQDLLKVHADNGITGGCVASLNSIFYNDPVEGEEELHEALEGLTGYSHIITVNPMLSAAISDIRKCLRMFPVKGVRIYPGYHNYSLSDPRVSALCDELENQKLPLFLPLRMEDERSDYLMMPRVLPMDELKAFVTGHPNLTIILLNIRTYELTDCCEVLKSSPNLLFDTSGFSYDQFNVENYTAEFGPEKIVYGSLFPLYCMKSTILQVEKADVTPQVQQLIFFDNIKAVLKE